VLQFEAALAVDAATTLRLALSSMAALQPDIFRHVTRNGRRYNNGSRQIDCDADPVLPWRHGRDVMRAVLQVGIHELTTEMCSRVGMQTHSSIASFLTF